jgi:ankyrin repeat protein
MVQPAVPVRLRQAILMNDVLLVKRIVKNNPGYLENPDFADRGNTSLHLAAVKGHADIVKLLISYGHDSCVPVVDRTGYDSAPGISRNLDSSTPLHLAASHSNTACVDYLCLSFPHIINWGDGNGMTALMLAAQSSNPSHSPLSTFLVAPEPRLRALTTGAATASEDTATISTLLSYNASLTVTDNAGNTALHHASAWGNLKAVRVLLSAGAAPLALNKFNYTPLDYSITVQAAQYFQNLMSEFERRKIGDSRPPSSLMQLRLNTFKAAATADENRSPIRTSPVQLRMKEAFGQINAALMGKTVSLGSSTATSTTAGIRLVLDTDSPSHDVGEKIDEI